MTEAHVTANISGDLIGGVRHSLLASLDLALSGRVGRFGINSYTPHAYSAYVSAVASIEAFVNEVFLGWMCRSEYPQSPLWQIPENSLWRMDLQLKLIVIPQLLFGSTFARDQQPFQDFALLCRVRNDMVHFKMQFKAPKYIQTLEQRKVAFVRSVGQTSPWPLKLACTEGIRWAHNAACKVAQGLAAYVPEHQRQDLAGTVNSFVAIEASEVTTWLHARSGQNAA